MLLTTINAPTNYQIDIQDAGLVWNQESGIGWAKPGEFLQYTLTNGPIEIRIMRIATFQEIEYCVCFGPDLSQGFGERMSFEDMKTAVQSYLIQSGGG